MGGEGKSRKRRSSVSRSSDDDKSSAKKLRKRDDEKKSKKENDEKPKKMKRDSKSRERLPRREPEEEEKKRRHQHTKKPADEEGFKELSDEDYFSKNNEFSTWLKEKKGLYFSDLSSAAARKLFASFVKAWNRKKLQPWYYDGISSAPRTAHNWNIKHDPL